jgi:hypothetical protein
LAARKFFYNGFGFNIGSELELPELTEVSDNRGFQDIEIEIGAIPYCEEMENNPYYHFVRDNTVLFNIPGKANFSIQDGNKITVSPIGGIDMDVIRLYILGTCMGVILIQRKIIPLHGSAVEVDGKAYVFVGESGAGKSTLASAFIKQGHRLLSDDVVPVSFSQNNVPTVIPAYPQQKLWQQSLDYFGKDSKNYRPIYERETKFSVPVESHFSTDVTPIAGVFELVIGRDKEIDLTINDDLQRIHILIQHTYRNFMIPRLQLIDWHFQSISKIIPQIEMYKLFRPAGDFTVDKLYSTILQAINKEEFV